MANKDPLEKVINQNARTMKYKPPLGYFLVKKGTTLATDLVWNKDKKDWERVDSINEYVSEYLAVARGKIAKISNPLEKVIEKKVCDHAKQLGCLVYKFTSPSRRSVPDRIFIMPDGKGAFFIEFKRKGAKPTEAQKIEIAKIRGQGMRVFVIDNVEAGKACVADMWHGVACATIDGYKGCAGVEGGCPQCAPKEEYCQCTTITHNVADKRGNVVCCDCGMPKPWQGVTMNDPAFN